MTAPSDFREISQRAELEFHLRPHRFRARAWWSGVILSLICCAWLAYAAVTGNNRIYEAGPLSDAHTFIANDCRQCHTTWQPVRRLATGASGSSISNQACLKCHTTDGHHRNQVPAHSTLSCAECHREHLGQHTLARVNDRHCTNCHANLQTTDGPSAQFPSHIQGFSEADGHPPFNLTARLASAATKSNLLTREELDLLLQQHPVEGQYQQRFLDVLSARQDANARAPALGDRGNIKFNHAAHLDPVRIKDKTGQHVDLSQTCQACHVPDVAGQYMQPIRYEQHCAACHPLLFDNQNFPGDEVPHETPAIVRGFLTEKYTLSILKSGQPLEAAKSPRPLPGNEDQPAFSTDQARRVEELVALGEQLARDHGRAVKSQGGCKLCHTVNETAGQRDWSIVPTEIPEQWLPHSEFHHASHRMLQCVNCHVDVAKKKDTADVMLPTIENCRQCHISASAVPRRKTDNTAQGRPAVAHDVSSRCMMCHTYHRRSETEAPGANIPATLSQPDGK